MRKNLARFLLLVVMVLTGVCSAETKGSSVEAAESTEVSFIAENRTISEYRDSKGYTYPKPTTTGKEDWLFAGWYVDEGCTTPYTEESIRDITTAWAKYVPAEVLSAKCQVTAETDEYSDKTDMRFITTVDSSNYSEVGFEITSNGKTFSFPTTTVFKRINSAIDGLECGFSPVAFDVESEYFMTFTITDILNKYFDRLHFVRPYWVTMDGTTVYGICRNARVSDSYNKIANIPVRLYSDATLSAGSLQVAYDSTKFEYLEYEVGNVDAGATAANSTDNTYVTCNVSDQVNQKPDGMLVNLRFKIIGDVTSNTTFTVTNNSVSDSSSSANIPVFNSIYKTYVVAYDGTNADTSWYDEFASDSTRTKFTIATVADLYGFAELVNGGNNFTGKTIYLAADITVNTGDALNWKASGATYTWTPIGSYELARTFNGTFDGQGQSISGLYFSSDARGLGLFGFTGAGSLIQNVELENTYFCATATTEVEMGAIAGRSFGTIHNVYVADDVYLDCHGYYCGGIAGYNQYGTNKSYSNCWFDGNIDMQTTGRWGGGIIGYLHKDAAKFDMSHCLFSGTLTTAWNTGGAQVGGLVGCTAVSMDVSDCLITGSVTSTGNQFAFGAVFGSTTANTTLTIDNVYEDNATSKYTVGNSADGAGGTAAKITTYENADLLGYNGYKNLKNLGIYTVNNTASTNNWVMRSGDVPALKYWVKDWIDVSWYETATSGSDSFIINTVEELYGFAELSQTISFQGDAVKLGADIEVNRGDATKWDTDAPARAWIPAAKSTTFAGTFDGNGKTISGLYVNETTAFSGLFGIVGGTVQNLRIENSYIYSSGACAGSVAGASTGNVTNVYSDAYVTATSECGGMVGRYAGGTTATISGCWYAGTVSGTGQYCGGIAGGIPLGTKTISNCLVTGNVNSTVNSWAGAGGIVGGVNGYLNNSATVVEVTVTDCISAAKVRTTLTNGAGSVLGRAVAGAGNKVTFERVYTTDDSCYGASESATATTKVGVGDFTLATVTGTPIKKTTADLNGANGYKYTKLTFELTDGDGGTWVAIANGTPELAYFSDGTVSGLVSMQRVHTDWYYDNRSGITDTYDIKTKEDLHGLSALAAGGINFASKTVRLVNNIEMNKGTASATGFAVANGETLHAFTPIDKTSGFAGTFDGNGKTVSGLYVNETSAFSGLFGIVTGTVQNLRIENSYISGANACAGSVAGASTGNITNVYSNAFVTASAECGGIVGRYAGGITATIFGCWYAGTVSATGQYCGGIAGGIPLGTKTISNCLVTGNVNSTVNNWAGAGGIVGGINGYLNGNATVVTVTVTDCISAAKVRTALTNGAGSVLGRGTAGPGHKVTFERVYTTEDSCYGTSETATAKTMVGVGDYTYATVTGTPIKKTVAELTGANGYKNTMLSFELTDGDGGTWVAIANGTPELAYFSDATVSNLANVLQVHTDWYYNKSGVANVYNITTVADLYGFAQLVNTGVSFSGATVNLQTNLTVNSGDASKWATAKPNHAWESIGSVTVGKNFNGIFEGNGHTISGLYLSSGNIGLGLFGFTGAGSSIQNLKLANSYFCGTSTGDVELGAIAGRGLGNVSNVYVSNDVYMDCHGYYCGGIVGRNPFGANKVYSKCWFAGNIDMQATGRQGGGILGSIGIATLSMNECLFTGTITTANNTAGPQVGGLIGQVSAAVSLTDCLSGGKVTSTGSPNTYGSVFGYTAAVAISLTDVYEADDDCPYVIGNYGDNGTKTGSIITRDRYSLLGYGGYYELGSVFDFTNTWIAVQGSVPQLKGWGQTALDLTAGSIDTTWSGAGTSASPYLITSVNELFGLATMAKSTDYTGTYFKLTQSLAVNSGDSDTWNKNVSGIKYPWTPIGRNTATPFSGIFDGNNCTISGLYTDSKTGAWIGLFGKTGTGFAVRNVALTNSYLSCGTGVSGIAYIGSIVGECYGSVDNVYSDATIVSAGKDCGGIVGRINGTDTKSFGRCWYNGNITTSGNQCGGLIGNVIMGTLNMTNCVNTGVVKSIYTVTNNEQPRVGALIGMAWKPSSDTIINITDTIAAGTVSEQCYAGGIGTIAGYTSGAVELNYNDVYACEDTYGYAIGRTSDSTVITGVVIPSSKTDRFIGYCHDATENDGLDFTNIWAVRSEAGVPVIANFASVAGITTVATGNLNTQTGLASLGLSLANAENYGEGNYLLTVADDDLATKHNTYKSELERLGLSVYVDNVSALGTGGVYNRILKNSDNSLTVNLTYVARKTTTYISISSGKPLSSHLMPLTSTSNKYNVSFAMLPVYEPKDTLALGNAFVMQLKNGHFIVNDGGYALNDNIVVEYMQSKVSAGETPIVDAWFLSHLHGDHSMIFNGLRLDKELRESIRVEGIYFSMPNNDVIYNTDTAISGTEHCAAMIEAMKDGMQMMTTSDDKTTPLYRVQTGQRYYFDGVKVDVVLAQEQLPKGTYDDKVVTAAGEFNTTSTSLLFTTDTNQKIFVAGDINNVNTDYIMSAYGANCPKILSDINVFVAAHHGRNTVNKFTNWLKPNESKFDYVLFPTLETMDVVKNGNIDKIDTDANKTLCNKANNAYSYSDGLSTILTFTSSGITATRK